MTEGNKTDQKETNITPDSIKSWIKEHLKSQNSIMYAEGRNVIIKTMKGHKIVSIPSLKQTGLDPNLLKEKLGIKDINLLNNSGQLAGQTVMHFHLHVLPRYGNDEIDFHQVDHEPNFLELDKLYSILKP